MHVGCPYSGNDSFSSDNTPAPLPALLHTVVAAARNQDPERFNRLPECIEEFLDYGPALSCAFNRPGTLLASEIQPGFEQQERQLHPQKQ